MGMVRKSPAADPKPAIDPARRVTRPDFAFHQVEILASFPVASFEAEAESVDKNLPSGMRKQIFTSFPMTDSSSFLFTGF